jgi:hypothetical protein
MKQFAPEVFLFVQLLEQLEKPGEELIYSNLVSVYRIPDPIHSDVQHVLV